MRAGVTNGGETKTNRDHVKNPTAANTAARQTPLRI